MNLLGFPIKTLVLFIQLIMFSCTTFAADFVGSQQCQSCHQQEYNAWQGSHHQKSMQHATIDSVLGDFAQVSFQGNTFFKKENGSTTEFWVNIKGQDGKFHDYQIKYTFAYTPLQQYMVEFADGRVQLIPFAWDSRSQAQGGQRWFNLYPDKNENHQEFFWTNTGQNWNYMCADCHSTNVAKNFDVNNNRYNTSYSEINVACESCHGAASEHMAWTTDETIANAGFNRDLSTSVEQWQFTQGNNTLEAKTINHSQQVLTCAQCHSRRTQISNKSHVEGNAFGERYLLDLVSSGNYYPDGQIYDEVFVYGSFLQSKMFQQGVVCSNCHDPHSAKLKMPAQSLCAQCHLATTYAVKSHHQHEQNSTGAQCINCHMPETVYMQVDPRRDHGFHVPRPDLALQLGTPDTCLNCHDDKNSRWSLTHVNTWFANTPQRLSRQQEKDFSAVFAASTMSLSNQEWQSVASELSRIAQTISYAPIIRASALTKMTDIANSNTVIAIARSLKSDNEYIRLGAVIALQGRGGQAIQAEKWRLLSPLLTDQVLAVRTAAAFTLTSLWQQLNQAQQKQLTPALNEYMTSQDFNNDRSYAHSNKGIIYSYQGQFDLAIKSFSKGIAIEPNFAQAYINLSLVYRQINRHKQVLDTLTEGITANPSDAHLLFELAMAYIRSQDKKTAAYWLSKATQLAPQNSHYFYVLGLSLAQLNHNEAYKAITTAYSLSENPQHLYALCEMQLRDHAPQAKHCLSTLEKLVPENVIEQLKAQMK